MQFDAVTIERMVQDVLKQLQPPAKIDSQASGATKLLSVPATKSAVSEEIRKVVVPPSLVLADRIITADLLKEKTSPASQIVIGPKSIITPAAQDFLRLNHIT